MDIDMQLLLLIGKGPPTDPETARFGISAISTAEFKQKSVKDIANQYQFVLVHRSVDETMVSGGMIKISEKLTEEMPGRVGFLSAGGEACGNHLGLPVLGRIGSSDDVVRAARRTSLSTSFKGKIEELVELLAQEAPQWSANLRACGILLQGLWALTLAEARSNSKQLSAPVMQCCRNIGFSPLPDLPTFTQSDRGILIKSFLETTNKILSQTPLQGNGDSTSDWISDTKALSELTEKIGVKAKDKVDWSEQSFADPLITDLLIKATDGVVRLCRKYLD
jgi:hypothetical protein